MIIDNNFEFPRTLVGVAGGSASGKTTLCTTISNEMQVDKQLDLLILSVDNFQLGIRDYKGPIEDFDFDDPNIIDWEYLLSTLSDLVAGKPALIPDYDFVIHKRVPQERWTKVESRQIIFLEGIFALWHPKVRAMMNYKIFIDCDDDIRLCRRMLRDISERGRDVKSVLLQYNRFVKPAYTTNIHPTKKFSDIVVPGFKNNRIAVNLLVQQLKHQNKELNDLRNRMNRHLVFFGDILHDIQICVGFFCPIEVEETGESCLSIQYDQLQRKVFFTNDKQKQKELIVFVRYLAKGETFIRAQFKTMMKMIVKYSFNLIQSALSLKKIDFNSVQAISLDQLLENEQLTLSKQFVVVVVPFLIDEEDKQLLRNILDMVAQRGQPQVDQSQYAQVQLILVNHFAHISNIMDMTTIENHHFNFLINIFMIASRARFYQHLSRAIDFDPVTQKNKIFAKNFEKQFNRYFGKQQKRNKRD